jgi:formylglycine-generating enzyme required for sulfatase activity
MTAWLPRGCRVIFLRKQKNESDEYAEIIGAKGTFSKREENFSMLYESGKNLRKQKNDPGDEYAEITGRNFSMLYESGQSALNKRSLFNALCLLSSIVIARMAAELPGRNNLKAQELLSRHYGVAMTLNRCVKWGNNTFRRCLEYFQKKNTIVGSNRVETVSLRNTGFAMICRNGMSACLTLHCVSAARWITSRSPHSLAFSLLIYFFVSLFLFSTPAFANNLSITNSKLISQDATANTYKIQFDITWENSWRDGVNYDAAWVVAKYTTDNGLTWYHATLKLSGTNPSGTSTGSGTAIEIVVPQDLKGAFIERSSSGSGTLSTTSVQLVWDYGVAGLTDEEATQQTIIKIYGIEMTYIPQGAFYAGDGNDQTSLEPFSGGFKQSSTDTDPWYVNDSEDMVVNTSGEFYYTTNGDTGEDTTGATFTIPSSFPNGYDAFYLMKYELSQGAYRDFLNTLTRTQQAARVGATISSDIITNYYVMSGTTSVLARQGIRAPSSGNTTNLPVKFGCSVDGDSITNESDDGEWVAMNYISWPDVAAYADWTALRPITELEYEKSARSTNVPVFQEYAWGTVDQTEAVSASITSPGTSSETGDQEGPGLSNYCDGCAAGGPLRSGFAATSSTSRTYAGAGYYGNMELAGNVFEPCVHVGISTGRAFDGRHGDGALNTTGNANVSNWPGTASGQVTDGTGTRAKGGAWNDSNYPISDRTTSGMTSVRNQGAGIRLARAAAL